MSNLPSSRLLCPKRARSASAVACSALAGLVVMPSSLAQYAFNPASADEQMPGVRYFGSAKNNDNGTLLPGVTVVLDSKRWSFVLVTDEQGRFRSKLPLGALTEKPTAKCVKPGFELVRVTYRPGSRSAPQPTVQVDCLLRQVNPDSTETKP